MNYLLFPGNPPAVYHYELWGREIIAQVPGARVRVSHYPDIEPTTDSPKVMRDILDAHFEQLKSFHQSSGEPVTLIGHSLGAHFVMGLLERAPGLIQKAILIHPFLRMPSLRGRIIVGSAGSLYTQDRFQKVILRSRKTLERFAAELSHVKNEEILRTFHIARHESVTIARDRSPIVIQSNLRNKIQVFYTPGDTWCQPSTVADLRKQVSVHECPEPHGFIMTEKHRRNLFNRILSVPPR